MATRTYSHMVYFIVHGPTLSATHGLAANTSVLLLLHSICPQGKGLDCKGVCNAPAAKTIFRMKMPSAKDALAGKWPGWVTTAGQSWEDMPIPRVFADAVLLPTGDVSAELM